MKKLIILLFALISINSANAQGCLPEGITFTTQEEIDNFQTNYPGCTEIEGDVTIEGGDILNLNGLCVLNSIGGNLTISYDSSLIHLAGLDHLITIGGSLSIYGNVLLQDIADLAGLESVGGGINLGVEIWDWWTGRYFFIGNHSLTSLSGLQGITIATGIGIIGNDLLTNLTGLNNIVSINGSLYISGNDSLTNFLGLDALTEIGSDLFIQENHHLNDFGGLNSLTSIAGKVQIGRDTRNGYEGWPPPGGNSLLESFSGIDNLTFIGGDFIIGDNNSLASLSGLTGVNTINGSLIITSDTNLTSLNGLQNVNLINGELSIYGTALTDLYGIENIEPASISKLGIVYNFSLSTCEAQSICHYLAAPNGTIEIHSNAPGCNSPEEVEAACALSVESIEVEENYFLFPNPAKQSVTITSKSESLIEEVTIYNQTGQRVYCGIPENNRLDISRLQSGIYVVEVVSNVGKEIKKLIIK